MLSIGINTYVDIDEANLIIQSEYPLGDNFNYWDALTNEQKEALLIKSTKEIERLPVNGIRIRNVRQQPLQFPRRSEFFREFNVIPEEVKEAECINAIALMLEGLNLQEKDGKILTSLKAEERLRTWTSGGFKMRGGRW